MPITYNVLAGYEYLYNDIGTYIYASYSCITWLCTNAEAQNGSCFLNIECGGRLPGWRRISQNEHIIKRVVWFGAWSYNIMYERGAQGHRGLSVAEVLAYALGKGRVVVLRWSVLFINVSDSENSSSVSNPTPPHGRKHPRLTRVIHMYVCVFMHVCVLVCVCVYVCVSVHRHTDKGLLILY